MAVQCLRCMLLSRYFVNMSATLSVPKTFMSAKSFVQRWSCTHKFAAARCRMFPRPLRRQIPTAAVESVWRTRDHVNPRSAATDLSPMEMDAPRVIPPSSASALDSVTVPCVMLQCRKRCEPLMAAPPEVLRLVDKHPAKSVSTDVVMVSVEDWNPNCQTMRLVPIKYRVSLRKAFMACSFGLAKHRQSSFVAKEMSGRSRAR